MSDLCLSSLFHNIGAYQECRSGYGGDRFGKSHTLQFPGIPVYFSLVKCQLSLDYPLPSLTLLDHIYSLIFSLFFALYLVFLSEDILSRFSNPSRQYVLLLQADFCFVSQLFIISIMKVDLVFRLDHILK